MLQKLIIGFYFLAPLACTSYPWEYFAGEQLSYLEGRIPEHSGRYRTFLHALTLMKQRNAKTLVETGTARCGGKNCMGDGCSTIIFGEWAKKNGATLYSVDINAEFLRNAGEDLGDSKDVVHLVQSDSVTFLKNFSSKIDFLYLDSYDYEDHNPGPSQIHHLNEILAVYPCLTEDSIIMIDDCNLPNGGKGRLVVDYLLKKGWRIVENEYQILLTLK